VHELAICQDLLAQLEALARTHHASLATRVVVGIGPLSGVEASLLERAFSIARAGTVAERATLAFEELPIRVRCRQCGRESEGRPNRLDCPACGDFRTELVTGAELMLMRVELEDE